MLVMKPMKQFFTLSKDIMRSLTRTRLCLVDRAVTVMLRRKQKQIVRAFLELLIASQLVIQAQLREVSNLDSLCAQEDAAFGSAREVFGAVHATIVLTCRLIERHADPGSNTWNVWDLTDERNDATAVVVRRQDAAAETLLDACWSSMSADCA
jgi:hypothetical protein